MNRRKLAGSLGLPVLGLVLGSVIALVVLRLTVLALDIHDPDFVYEDRIDLWQPDSLVGFVNRPDFDGYACGNVRIRTDARGFRGSRPVRPATPGRTRILGIGDSVMWGVAVGERDAFMGVLAEMLERERDDIEVLNAGVVGYSTLQEAIFLRQHALDHQPDVVLFNFCINDYIPSADPFGNLQSIHLRYLVGLLRNAEPPLTDEEREGVRWLIGLLSRPVGSWDMNDPAMGAWWRACYRERGATARAMFQIFIERPLRAMAALCREHDIRLIGLIIPTRTDALQLLPLLAQAGEAMERHGIERIDLVGTLAESAVAREQPLDPAAAAPSLPWPLDTPILRDLQTILTHRSRERAHREQVFFDFWHPSRRGNRMIAETIRAQLSADAASPVAAERTPDRFESPGTCPPTRIDTVIDTLHGVAIPDPYRWLEDQESPETRAWIEAQSACTRAALEPLSTLPALQSRLGEMMRIDRVGRLAWERRGRFFLWKKRAEDDLWSLHVRQGLDGEDGVLIDPHRLSDDHTANVELLAISRDGRLLAYGIRRGGEDEVALRVLDVESREDLPDRLPRALYTGVGFTDAGTGLVSGLVYGRHDRSSGSRIYRHDMGTDASADIELFGEGFPADRWISPEVSPDGRHLLIVVYHGWSRSEVYLQDLAAGGAIRTVVDDVDAMFSPQFAGDRLIVLTDWKAPNRRLLAIDLDRPERDAWQEIVPAGPDPIEDFSAAGGRLFLHYLHDVTSRIETRDPDGRPLGEVALPGIGRASVPFGDWEGGNAFFSFQSFTTPRTTYRLDIATGRTAIWGRDSVPFESADYTTQQVWFTSKDGTRVPMFVVHRRDLERTGDQPTLLYGYGGFNQSQTPSFSPSVALWLEQGGIYALANIRGGGEFGEAWHRAGMLEKKQNVFDDFIAAAEWLIASGYTNPSRLAIRGGSNGGLLVGAALTQRPELFQAVLCEYPDLDMVRYYQSPNLNRPALAEYGGASDPEQFAFLHAYSPYQRVTDGTEYPVVLLVTGDTDTRVPPLQARKMAARLQAATTSDRPILLRYHTEAGHSGGQPMSEQIEETALEFAFLLWQLGVESR